MRQSNRSWRMLALVWLTALCVGCGGSDGSKAPGGPGSNPADPNGSAKREGEQGPEKPPEEKPLPPPTIPEVVFDDALKATCKVWVGDPMPEGQLADLEGNVHPIKDYFGKRLTVVVFWTGGSLYALQELKDLGKDVVDPYSGKGVSVVTIDVDDPPDQVRQALERTGAKLPVLLDPKGAYFGTVATARLPRTYVLGPDGKILWFDADYSPATSRSMIQTIQVALGEIGKH